MAINRGAVTDSLLWQVYYGGFVEERAQLARFAAKAVNAVSGVDDNVLFFLEPYTADASMVVGYLGTDRPRLASESLYRRCVWAPHMYQPLVFGPSPIGILCTHLEEAAALEMPCFIGGKLPAPPTHTPLININRIRGSIVLVRH